MRLVIQSPTPFIAARNRLEALLPPPVQWQAIAEYAYTSPIAQADNALANLCAEQGIDCAFVDDAHHLQALKLCVMDMDSTLITMECIDEIAAVVGKKDEIAAITERAMRGELDFETSLRARVAMLEGVREADLEYVRANRLQLSPGAKEWIAAAKSQGIYTVLVSGGFTFFANHVQAILGLDMAISNTLEIINGKLTGRILGDVVDGAKKASVLLETAQRLNLDAKQQAFAIGDGANDLAMMNAGAFGIAYRAKPIVQKQARYALNAMDLRGVIGLLQV